MCVHHAVWLCVMSGLLSVDVLARHRHPISSHTNTQPTTSDLFVAIEHDIFQEKTPIIWGGPVNKDPNAKPSHLLPDRNYNKLHEATGKQRRSRRHRHRRHNNGGSGRSHLMRVGCVLGTCQVQNLSHRLYQLIGQSGREDSSPIDPRSPHSFG